MVRSRRLWRTQQQQTTPLRPPQERTQVAHRLERRREQHPELGRVGLPQVSVKARGKLEADA